jgi:hypothetical protein
LKTLDSAKGFTSCPACAGMTNLVDSGLFTSSSTLYTSNFTLYTSFSTFRRKAPLTPNPRDLPRHPFPETRIVLMIVTVLQFLKFKHDDMSKTAERNRRFIQIRSRYKEHLNGPFRTFSPDQ